MALGETVAYHASRCGLRPGLQTVYNLSKWPSTEWGVVGGGAIAYRDPLRQLTSRFGKQPHKLAILGVDFNDVKVIEDNALFLSQVGVITCRSSKQAAHLSQFLGRPDIRSHVDLTFASLWAGNCTDLKSNRRANSWGISCPPLFFRLNGKKFVLGNIFLEEMALELPELRERLDHYADQYIQMLRTICRRVRALGHNICHLPFTPIDDLFARQILADEQVSFLPYDRRPAKVYQTLKGLECFISGRFHALAFALQTQTPCLPFCYASKSRRLLEDIGIPKTRFVGIEILGERNAGEKLWSLKQEKLILPQTKLVSMFNEVREHIQNAFVAIGAIGDV